MDPIHPIAPRPPEIPAIAPARSDRAARDRREQRRREQERRRESEQRDRHQRQEEREQHPDADSPYSPDGEGPHRIDIRA